MTFDVKINFDGPLDLIEPNYPGNYPDQMPIYLEIDWERREITAFTRNYQIGGTPGREWHGLATTYQLPNNTRADRLAGWVADEIVPLVDKLVGKFESVWDGSNWVGRWPDELQDDLYDFVHRMDAECAGMGSIPTINDDGGLWHVTDWLSNSNLSKEYNITPGTTDDRLQEIANEIESDAVNDDVVLSGDLLAYLHNIRDEVKS